MASTSQLPWQSCCANQTLPSTSDGRWVGERVNTGSAGDPCHCPCPASKRGDSGALGAWAWKGPESLPLPFIAEDPSGGHAEDTNRNVIPGMLSRRPVEGGAGFSGNGDASAATLPVSEGHPGWIGCFTQSELACCRSQVKLTRHVACHRTKTCLGHSCLLTPPSSRNGLTESQAGCSRSHWFCLASREGKETE